MTTEAQINANRANAQKSTGPRTPEGKAKVAQNALKHGLLAKEAVVVGEDLDDFELYRAQLRAELAPVGMVESLLAERIVGLFWRLQRAERFHTATFDMLYLQGASDPQNKRWQPAPGPDGADPLFGLTAVKDFSQTRVLERLLVYERRMEYSLYRTMAELRNLRKGGRGDGAKGTRSQEQTVLPSAVPTFLPSCAVSPLPEEVERGGPTHEEPPGGIATNGAEPQELSCETKPIGEAPTAKAVAEATAPGGTGMLPVNRNHGQDGGPKRDLSRLGTSAHATEPQDGVTTNVPEAQEPACETKPISERRIRDGEGYRPIFRRRR